MKKSHNSLPSRKLSRRKASGFFLKMSSLFTRVAGRPVTTLLAFAIVLLWGLSGKFFGFSETWQLLINTTTTIITFLMVFIIQQSQNRDSMAVQLKLNELIAANKRASNRLVDIEDLSTEELDVLKKFYVKLADLAEAEQEIHTSHSIDEAEKSHDAKGNIGKSSKKPTSSKARSGSPTV